MRILISDLFWPTPYAKWRIQEIQSFVEKYTDVDILARSSPGKLQTSYEIQEVRKIFPLDKYDFVSLHPKNNSMVKKLNQLLNNNYDGSCSIALAPASDRPMYLLRRRSHRNEKWSVHNYSCIYSIFLGIYHHTRALFPKYPVNKHVIHMHVGGGVTKNSALHTTNVIGGIVVTQYNIYNRLVRTGYPKHKIIQCYGNTILPKDFTLHRKTLKPVLEPLNIAYAALGTPQHKGHNSYRQITQMYRKLYPTHKINFYIIGTNPAIPGVISKGKMSQNDLDEFYRDQVDIYLNPETGIGLNGFPLGKEAGVQGCVLCTTDPVNYNRGSGFNFTNDEMLICNTNLVNRFVAYIAELYTNREKLLATSIKSQDRFYSIFSYEEQQAKIFNYIDSHMN